MRSVFTLLFVSLCLQLSVMAAAPTVPASNLKFTLIDGNRISGSCTAGNGSTRIVVMKEGSPVTGLPVNGVEYSSNTSFGSTGTAFTAAGEFVVQKTGWGDFQPQNLKPNTVYYFAIFEYNGTGSGTQYLMLPLTGSQSTAIAPTLQVSNLSATVVSGNSLTLNWTNGNGNGRLVIARKAAAVNAEPTDLVNYYSADGVFESGTKINTDNYVVYRGTGSSAVIKNLEPNTLYHFAVFEYNGQSFPVHLLPGALFSVTTHAGPTQAAANIGFSYVEGNRFTTYCTAGNGSRRLFIMRKGSPVTAVPANGTSYTASNSFGSGTEIAPGEYVVESSAASSINVTNLEAATTYYVRIYEYDADKTGYTYYLLSAWASKSGSTASAPTIVASNLTPTLSGSSASISFTPGNGTFRMAVMKEGSAVDCTPADFVKYPGNSSFGSGTAVSPSNYSIAWGMNGTSVSAGNLKPGVSYHLAIYEFNGYQYPVYSATAGTCQFTIPLEPTMSPKDAWYTSVEGHSFRLIWTNGNGARRIVVARKGAAVTARPADAAVYTASANFGEGSEPAPGEFVVADGTSNYVDLKKLDLASTYYFAVFEYNVDATGKTDYLTSSFLSSNGSTVSWPTVQTTLQATTGIQSAQATLNFTKGNGSSRIIVMREGAAVNASPQDIVKYAYSSAFGTATTVLSGDNYVVMNTSAGGSVIVTKLKPNTTYYVSAFEYNGSNEPAYQLANAPMASFTTIDVPGATVPTTAASNPVFSNVDGNKLSFKWSNGDGQQRIVVMKKGSAASFVPAAATTYTANASFGSGSDVGNGEYVVYNGSGSTVDISNLEPSTVYYFTVFEYNGTADLTRYLVTPALTTSNSTATAPLVSAADVTTSSTANSVTLNWTKGNGSGRIVVMKEGSSVSAIPADLGVYPANAAFKSGSQVAAGEYVVYAGTGNSVTVTGLTTNTQYYYRVFEYNGSTAPVYNTTDAVTGAALVSSPLPVIWLYFTAGEHEGRPFLQWATATEVNNDHFVVERSTDGSHFAPLQTIAGAGNSNSRHEYQYTDETAAHLQTVYYRIKQADANGQYTYSGIQMIQRKAADQSLRIFPNPVGDQFSIRLPKGMHEAVLTIYNAAGGLLLHQKIGARVTVNSAAYAKGIYHLVIRSGEVKLEATMMK